MNAISNTSIAIDRVALITVSTGLELTLSHAPFAVWNVEFAITFCSVVVRQCVLASSANFLSINYWTSLATTDCRLHTLIPFVYQVPWHACFAVVMWECAPGSTVVITGDDSAVTISTVCVVSDSSNTLQTSGIIVTIHARTTSASFISLQDLCVDKDETRHQNESW